MNCAITPKHTACEQKVKSKIILERKTQSWILTKPKFTDCRGGLKTDDYNRYIFCLSKTMAKERCLAAWNLEFNLQSCHLVACPCKGCVSILLNCTKDLAAVPQFHDRILYPATSDQISFKDLQMMCNLLEQNCSLNLPLLCMYAECLKMHLVMDADIVRRVRARSCSLVGTWAVVCPPPAWCFTLPILGPQCVCGASWNSPITPVRGQTLREGASVRPLRKPILELMGPYRRGLPAKYLSWFGIWGPVFNTVLHSRFTTPLD